MQVAEALITVDAPELRIVSDALWQATRRRLAPRKAAHQIGGRGVRAHYFLTGFGRCAQCGGSIQAVSRDSGKGRQFRYNCST